MTARDLLRVCWRRWVVVLVALGLTALAAAMIVKPRTVYWSRVTIAVRTPAVQRQPGGLDSFTLQDQPPEAVSAAAVLAVRVNGGIVPRRAVSPAATLYGEGYLEASSARVRDTGGQWTSQVSDPVIDVEAVDLTAEATYERISAEVDKVVEELDTLQNLLKVAPDRRLTLQLSPETPRIEAIASGQTRAWFATSAFGLGVTLSFTYFLDRALTRRRSKKAPS